MSRITVIPGPSSQLLALRISRYLKSDVVPIEFKTFPDGERYIRLKEENINNHAVVVQSIVPPNPDRSIIELCFILKTLKEFGVEKITAVIPYFAYARQDKRFMPGEAVSGRIVCDIIQNAGAGEVVTVDIHNKRILENFKILTKDVSAVPLIAEYLNKFDLNDPLIISPDEGAKERAKNLAGFMDAEYVIFSKFRDKYTGEIEIKMKEINVNNRDAVIIDDIISTGGTMVSAIEIAKSQNANRIYAACTHAILVGDSRFRIFNAGANEIIGTDTVPSDVSFVSVAPAIAEALK
ncbi:MAG: ribose-phosphate diphosphokinase [Candidatus Jordarchaeum sp.]|uniref:ribose-phosphate diphosphokinase n=1 Tax=Candidatus Jordarchaeum sp. TaxID=2823881 RepID=UPI00404B7A46